MTAGENEAQPTTGTRRTPLPKWQLAIVYAIQLSEPISATVIYPFLPDFVRQTGVTGGDESKTGYYAGLIGSVFFGAECLSVFHWGRASDSYGRRPVLLWGPLGLAISLLGFGLSSNFWWLVVFRALQGIFNGNIGVSKTIIAELTDASNIGDAFAIMPLMWGLGNALGPVIGGLLADPEHTWPRTFGRVSIFVEYPYLLPCGVAALFSFLTYVCALVSLKETLPPTDKPAESTALLSEEPSLGYGSTESSFSTDGRQKTSLASTPKPKDRVINRNLLLTVGNYCALSFISMGFTVLQPLMYSTSIPVGGLGMSPYEIGVILSVWGLLNVAIQLSLLGRALRRFGNRGVFIASMIAIFMSSCIFGAESFAARLAGRVDAVVWTLICIQLAFNVMLSAAFASVQILIVQSATSRSTLGSTNGLAQMAASGVRGLSPSILSSLFSVTLDHHLVGGFLVYICMSALALLGAALSFMVPRNLKAT